MPPYQISEKGEAAMGKTIIMKIMERAAGRPVKIGERVWCNVDLASARDFGGAKSPTIRRSSASSPSARASSTSLT